jgi:cysteinyl-tRNA synthetase
MSLDLLGEGFDIHGGGLDLTFPHHENERAQAVADGKSFVTHWMHNGFVEMEGEKMSKSLGNVKNLLDLAEQYDPRAYRLLVLQSHYRSPIEVTDATMGERGVAMGRLDTFARRTTTLVGQADSAVLDQFRAAMDDDFDSPAATDLLFRQVREGNSLLDSGDTAGAGVVAATVREIAGALGLELDDGSGADDTPADVLAKVAARTEAKAARDFATADALRDELLADGWIIEDSAAGPTVRRS